MTYRRPFREKEFKDFSKRKRLKYFDALKQLFQPAKEGLKDESEIGKSVQTESSGTT